MADEFVDLGGTSIGRDDLTVARTRDLASRLAARQIPYASLVECRWIDDTEAVVVDLEVEVPQQPQFDIRATERIAVCFESTDTRMPVVIPMRRDFPSVPHLNLTAVGAPKSICLFEVPYRDVRPRMTTPLLIERIREWLRLTSRGELHAADQSLEPLLFGAFGQLIVPHTIVSAADSTAPVFPLRLIRRVATGAGELWVAEGVIPSPPGSADVPLACAVIRTPPRVHGVIANRPPTLLALHEFLRSSGLDGLTSLRDLVLQWRLFPQLLRSPFMLIVVAPKMRNEGGPIESHEIWAFLSASSLTDVGVDIGIFGIHEGIVVPLIPPDETACGEHVELHLLNVVKTISRDDAAVMSGRGMSDERRFVAVGVGALGSQVMLNAARIAFGRWTAVDEDVVFPHNIVRHALPGDAVSFAKAHAVAIVANGLVDRDPGVHASVVADVLMPGDAAAQLSGAFDAADTIVDMSSSILVARHLARNVESEARRISLFLNPSGADLVLLSESRDRAIQLDSVEMQYYRALLESDDLAGHLAAPPDQVRFSRSCRDVSARISQEVVALHAAIGVRAIRAVAEQDGAAIRIWRANPESGEVSLRQIVVEPSVSYEIDGWKVIMDEGFRRRLATLRSTKLPRETGGVVLGSFDLERRIVYVVDTIPSPPDSEERVTSYVRGSVGLSAKVSAATDVTGGEVEYVGEWHSHPRGHSCEPSANDVILFGYLSDHMDVIGLPAVMMIVGHNDALAVFVGQMVVGELREEHRVAVVSGVVPSATLDR